MSLAKRYDLICPESKDGVSRALFHPEIAIINLFDSIELLFLRQFADKTVDDSVESSEQN